LGDFKSTRFVVMLFWGGKHVYFIYLFIFLLCIARPICVCLTMIGYCVIREQMIWQVSQEML